MCNELRLHSETLGGGGEPRNKTNKNLAQSNVVSGLRPMASVGPTQDVRQAVE